MDDTNEKIMALVESVLLEGGRAKTQPPSRPMKPGRYRTAPIYVTEFVLDRYTATSSWQDPDKEWLHGERESNMIRVKCLWLDEKTNIVRSGELGIIFVHSNTDPEYARKLAERLNSYYANHWIICDKKRGSSAIDRSSIHLAPDQPPPPAPKPPPPPPPAEKKPEQLTLGI